MRPVLALAGVAAAFAAVGCGGDDSPATAQSEKAEIADTVNRFFAAWNRGDGEAACSLVSPRGQALMPKIAGQLNPPGKPYGRHVDCATAAERSAAASQEPIGEHIAPDRVHFHGPMTAIINSKSRGAMFVVKLNGVWLVGAPTFID